MICQFAISIARTPRTQGGTQFWGAARNRLRQLVQYCRPWASVPLLTNWKQRGQRQRMAIGSLESKREEAIRVDELLTWPGASADRRGRGGGSCQMVYINLPYFCSGRGPSFV